MGVSLRSSATRLPISAARSRSRGKLPRHNNRHGQSRSASARHRSGPMPAGSPEVMTTAGCVMRPFPLHAIVDVSLVAQATQPQLGLLVGLAGADLLVGVVPLLVGAHVLGTAAEHLEDVPAVFGVER